MNEAFVAQSMALIVTGGNGGKNRAMARGPRGAGAGIGFPVAEYNYFSGL
jgi:hypothetical protein